MNSDEIIFYPFTVNFNKCGRSCNTIDDPYARVCVQNKVKNMNIKLLNLISDVNKTRFLFQLEPCKCECGLNEIVCNA